MMIIKANPTISGVIIKAIDLTLKSWCDRDIRSNFEYTSEQRNNPNRENNPQPDRAKNYNYDDDDVHRFNPKDRGFNRSGKRDEKMIVWTEAREIR